MTLFHVLAVVALVIGTALPASAGDWQRARARLEPSSAAPAADAPAARAVPRPQEERQAVERPFPPRQDAPPSPAAPVSAPAVPAPAVQSTPTRETSRRDPRPTGPTIVTPSFSAPVTVGGIRVGEPFVVGNAFAVGHVPTPPDEDRPRRRDHDDRRSKYGEVVVPVPVYVPVEVYADSGSSMVDDAAVTPVRSGSIRDLARGSNDAGEMSGQPEGPRRSYFHFVPWFTAGNALTAGVPVPLPSPETFEERNVSEKVLLETQDASLASGVRRTYALGVGGLAFAIKPADAAVYIDGYFVGSAYDFGPDREPLLLRGGSYTLELRAEGFVTEKFPVYVTMGEVLPFSGALMKIDQPLR